MDYSRQFRHLRRVAKFGLLALLFSASVVKGDILCYPKPESQFDERTGYPLTLLRLAFEQSKKLQKYQLLPTEIKMPRGRSLKLLEQGFGVDIFWSISSKEREKALLRVDFDIFRGEFGNRLLLVSNKNLPKFNDINHVGELKKLVAGLGHDWADYGILHSNGFLVQGTTSYAGLFRLLQKGRVDYLPRSVFEAWSEFEYFESQGIGIVDNIALYYPATFSFFVNKEAELLAQELEASLLLLETNGRFDSLFSAAWQDVLDRANFKDKQVFKLQIN